MTKHFLILIFLTCFSFCSKAQYLVSYTQPLPGTLRCQIAIDQDWNTANSSTNTLAENDLITWIFPDGQIFESTIQFSGATQSGNMVDWKPCRNLTAGATATAIVTKKGGTGNPAITITETNFPPTLTGPIATSIPAAFQFQTGAPWQLNYTWDFSPGYYTYLVISYKPGPGCSIDSFSKFEIVLPTGVSLIGQKTFNNEAVTPPNDNFVEVYNLNTSTEQKHILLKLAVNTSVAIGAPLNIKVNNNTCSPDGTTLQLTAKTVPHDPNQKTVDIKRICNKNLSTKLHYRVQFHNDGNAPVKKVRVTDCLPNELIPSTFVLQAPTMNGLATPFTATSSLNSPCKTIEFLGLGLPGLCQTNQVFLYSQTIYAYEFDVMTTANLTKDIDNVAVITFFNDVDGTYVPLDPITTNVERVYVGCEKPGFCHCFKSLFCRKCNKPKP